MTYPDYIDAETGRTLVCEPGGVYNVIPASGNIRAAATEMPVDGRFSVPEAKEKESRRRVPQDETITPEKEG